MLQSIKISNEGSVLDVIIRTLEWEQKDLRMVGVWVSKKKT